MPLALSQDAVWDGRDDVDSPGAWALLSRALAAFREVGENMSGKKTSGLAVAAAALIAGACASGAGTMQSPDADIADGSTVVQIENHNWSDMAVYVIRNGSKHRLGTVSSLSKESFRVPTHLLLSSGDVYLMADPIGSSQMYRSPPIMISPGQRAQWRLENSLALSSFWIR
jgi:hypothetical protein